MKRHASPRISIYREDDWPTAAPSFSELRTRAASVVQRVNEQLQAQASQRTLRELVLHANRRLSIRVKGDVQGLYHARVHWVLLDEAPIEESLAGSILHGSFPPQLSDAMDRLSNYVGPQHVYAERQRERERHLGEWINLRAVLETVQHFLPRRYSAEGVRITWGRRGPSRTRRRSIRLGSMDERRALIRIHPNLDSPWVPRMVVEFVVWHELCHYVAPPLDNRAARLQGQNRVHHDEFRTLESFYPHKDEAERWIRQNIHRLLAAQ